MKKVNKIYNRYLEKKKVLGHHDLSREELLELSYKLFGVTEDDVKELSREELIEFCSSKNSSHMSDRCTGYLREHTTSLQMFKNQITQGQKNGRLRPHLELVGKELNNHTLEELCRRQLIEELPYILFLRAYVKGSNLGERLSVFMKELKELISLVDKNDLDELKIYTDEFLEESGIYRDEK